MATTPMSPPMSFESISEKEKKVKLLKRQQIEAHWTCDIQESIPKQIRPRLFNGNKSKAKIGWAAAEAPWWRWSSELFYKLEHLAGITAGRHHDACELMMMEVQQRQRDYTSCHKDVAELLVSDLTKLVTDLRTMKSTAGDEDDVEDSGEDEFQRRANVEGNPQARSGDIASEMAVSTTRGDSYVKKEMADEDEDEDAGNYASTSQQLCTPKKETLKTHAKIASLRAAAMRLRQEAAKREADAYQLEADMLQAEAREIQ